MLVKYLTTFFRTMFFDCPFCILSIEPVEWARRKTPARYEHEKGPQHEKPVSWLSGTIGFWGRTSTEHARDSSVHTRSQKLAAYLYLITSSQLSSVLVWSDDFVDGHLYADHWAGLASTGADS